MLAIQTAELDDPASISVARPVDHAQMICSDLHRGDIIPKGSRSMYQAQHLEQLLLRPLGQSIPDQMRCGAEILEETLIAVIITAVAVRDLDSLPKICFGGGTA